MRVNFPSEIYIWNRDYAKLGNAKLFNDILFEI